MSVTYYLGAGASANAIPVVKDFTLDFYSFLNKFKDEHISTLNEEYEQENKILVLEFLLKIEDELDYQYSIDTYARKLFFQEKDKYEAIKNLISYYFLFKQMKEENSAVIEDIVANSDLKATNKKVAIDNRYDAFFAALIEEKTRNIKSNIQFISWNYDMQIELSFANFLRIPIEESFTALKSYPCVSIRDETNPKEARILKLNGTAGLFYENLLNVQEYKFGYNPQNKLNITFWDKCFQDVHRALKGDVKNYNSLLKYSWDYETEVNNARKRAKDLINNTDHLIIIGYSFPIYNRVVDKEIFSAIMPNTKITLQVLKDDFDSYRERLVSILPHLSKNDINFYDDIRQFYIPNELLIG